MLTCVLLVKQTRIVLCSEEAACIHVCIMFSIANTTVADQTGDFNVLGFLVLTKKLARGPLDINATRQPSGRRKEEASLP